LQEVTTTAIKIHSANVIHYYSVLMSLVLIS